MTFFIDYPDDWIGVPAFGPGEVFATPAAWAQALVDDLALGIRPRPKAAQRAALVDTFTLLGGELGAQGANAAYVWLGSFEGPVHPVATAVVARAEVGDATAAELAGADGEGDYVPPIREDILTDSGLAGVSVESHRPFDESAPHVAMLVATSVVEKEDGFLILQTSTTDLAGFEVLRPHFAELVRSVRAG